GLIVSLSGFSLALWHIKRTRTAAEHAEEAAIKARQAVQHVMVISDLSQVSIQIELIRELHRNKEWARAIDRYSPLRRLLTEARAQLPIEESVNEFTRAIMQLGEMEKQVTEEIAQDLQPSSAKLNNILVDLQQSLDEVRLELENHLSAESNVEANRYDEI
ncbi:MAG: hypothetical protein OXG80_06565, partial [Chloroflexi bacterium]|nr:hypothetical protein [Chloroflexota bacterium]